MRLWTPRRPSTSLKRKLLTNVTDSAETEMVTSASAKLFWGALGPTMACALLTLLAFNHGEGNRPSVSTLVWTGSNCVSDSAHSAQNHWASVTFDWTNHSVFQSSMGFTPKVATTNFSQ